MTGRSAARSRVLRALHRLDRWPAGDRGNLEPGKKPRLLFFKYETSLGAAVNATPVFEALKKALPACHITVAAAGLAYEVVKHNPNIDRLVKTPDPHANLPGAASRILGLVAFGARFDAVVTDAGSQKTRIALLGVLSRARRRLGYTLAPELYDATAEFDPETSVLRNNLAVLRVLGIEAEPTEPRVYFSRAELAAADALLGRTRSEDAQPLVVFVTQTSGGQPNHWYQDRFAAVADQLVARWNARILFVGTAEGSHQIEQIRRAMARDGSVNLAGQTDVPTLCALLCRCDVAVTLDTGTMHVARAAGLPMVVIAPAWQPAHEWLPLGLPACRIVRRDDIPCRHCRKFFCATHECMDEIGAAEVIEAVEALLAEHPPVPDRRQRRVERCLAHGATSERRLDAGPLPVQP